MFCPAILNKYRLRQQGVSAFENPKKIFSDKIVGKA